MRLASIALPLLLALQPVPGPLQQQTNNGTIEGVVLRGTTDEPVASAQVSLQEIRVPLATGGVLTGVLAAGGGGIAAGGAAGGGGIIFLQETSLAPPPLPGGPPQTQAPSPPLQPGGPPLNQAAPVLTDANGKFTFTNLNPGTYRIIVMANGYARQEHGQRVPNGIGVPIYLAASENRRDLKIHLTPTGVVSGRIFDDLGQPALGAPVQLLRVTYNAVQGRMYQAVSTAIANDRGEYRLFGIPPGHYYLAAGSPPGPPGRPFPGIAGGPPQPTAVVYGLSFYPGVAEASQAALIEVKSGSEVVLDLRAKQQQTHRVRGTVIDSRTGRPPANVSIGLMYRSLTGGGGSFSQGQSYDSTAGTFQLQNIVPGSYVVQAQLQEPLPPPPVDAASAAARSAVIASRPMAYAPITITDSDVEGVNLVIKTGNSIAGRVVVEGQLESAPLPNAAAIRLLLRPSVDGTLNPGTQTPATQPTNSDGTFQVQGVREGEYMATLAGIPAGYYIRKIEYGGADVLNQPMRVSDAPTGEILVTLRKGAAQVGGILSDSRSQPVAGVMVALIPQQRTRSDLFRTTPTDQGGQFTFANISPGEYKVISWEGNDPAAFMNPDFLRRYEEQGTPVRVAESGNETVSLRMIPLE